MGDEMNSSSVNTVWLLDVDGVINGSKPGWSRAPFSAMVQDSTGSEWKIRWEPKLIDYIRKVHAEGLAEVVWCTTWCPDADRLEKLWGLPELRRAWSEYKRGYYAVEAKREAARAVLAEGRRLVWTDDDAFPRRGPLVDELTADGRALLVKPDGRGGLRPEDVDAIDAFLTTPPEAALLLPNALESEVGDHVG